jgi:nitric oxide reductase subunit B
MMALLTLLPLGMLQLQAALEHGYWYARSADFMGRPIVDLLVWMRVPATRVLGRRAAAGLVRVALWVRRARVSHAAPRCRRRGDRRA